MTQRDTTSSYLKKLLLAKSHNTCCLRAAAPSPRAFSKVKPAISKAKLFRLAFSLRLIGKGMEVGWERTTLSQKNQQWIYFKDTCLLQVFVQEYPVVLLCVSLLPQFTMDCQCPLYYRKYGLIRLEKQFRKLIFKILFQNNSRYLKLTKDNESCYLPD